MVVESAGSTVAALPLVLQWSNLDITGVREVDVSLEIASINASTFEADDFLQVEFSVDGGAYFTVLAVRADNSGKMAVDINLDGLGDLTPLDAELTAESEVSSFFGSSLDVRLSISVDEVGEDFAVDTLAVTPRRTVEWTAPPSSGAASLFEASNWSTSTVPVSGDPVRVRNGGTAVSTGAAGGDPTALLL
ncbi:MAG: hypothetical protein AAFX50_04500, partial [Acidobacteriota bacterium]